MNRQIRLPATLAVRVGIGISAIIGVHGGNYRDAWQKVENTGRGERHLGFESRKIISPQISRNSLLQIYS